MGIQRRIQPTEINEYKLGGPFGHKNITVKPNASAEILEGTVVAKNTVTGLYEPYDSGGSYGLDVPALILDCRIPADATATPFNLPSKALWMGRLNKNTIFCNGAFGADATTIAALKWIFFDVGTNP